MGSSEGDGPFLLCMGVEVDMRVDLSSMLKTLSNDIDRLCLSNSLSLESLLGLRDSSGLINLFCGLSDNFDPFGEQINPNLSNRISSGVLSGVFSRGRTSGVSFNKSTSGSTPDSVISNDLNFPAAFTTSSMSTTFCVLSGEHNCCDSEVSLCSQVLVLGDTTFITGPVFVSLVMFDTVVVSGVFGVCPIELE